MAAQPQFCGHFRFRRDSGPCPDLPLANPVANDPNRTCHAHGILAFDCSKIGPGVHQGLAAGSWERTFQMSGLEL
jgi:hypothetical protein